jgi:hypothetical protein
MQTTQPALTIWVAAVTAAAAVLLLLVDHDQPSYWSGFWPALNWSRREKERKKERKERKEKRREEGPHFLRGLLHVLIYKRLPRALLRR